MRLFTSPRWTRRLQVCHRALVGSVMLASFQCAAQAQGKDRPVEHTTFYRTTQIDGLSIFYREAGPKDGPTLLLLHGLPSSSARYRSASDCGARPGLHELAAANAPAAYF